MRQIAVYAEEVAEELGNPKVSQEPVDADWLSRWRDGAEGISSEHLQRIWARLLAGEVKKPGSYAIQTLETLRSLSRQDAELIGTAASYCVGGNLIRSVWLETPSGEDFLIVPGRMIFRDILALEELGILTGAHGSFTATIRDDIQWACNNKTLIVQQLDPKMPFKCWLITVTRTGLEIMTLGHFNVNIEYVNELALRIKALGAFTVFVADRVQDKETGTFSLVNPVEIFPAASVTQPCEPR